MVEIIRTVSNNSDFQFLVSLLDHFQQILDGDEHSFYAQFNKIDTLSEVLVAYIEGIPVASGALRRYNNSTVEIKRMFVKPEYRGRGVAMLILKELESWAKELNFSTCILETGKKQIEAINLYKKTGYMQIISYGQYKNVENSVCMKKEIR